LFFCKNQDVRKKTRPIQSSIFVTADTLATLKKLNHGLPDNGALKRLIDAIEDVAPKVTTDFGALQEIAKTKINQDKNRNAEKINALEDPAACTILHESPTKSLKSYNEEPPSYRTIVNGIGDSQPPPALHDAVARSSLLNSPQKSLQPLEYEPESSPTIVSETSNLNGPPAKKAKTG